MLFVLYFYLSLFHNSKEMKQYYTQENIGKAKYVVNFHDGFCEHPDGSPFYEIRLFSNKKERNKFISKLKRFGYVERPS